jgi:pimeloyl-ACP methyl ester carboxylesterase
VEIVLVHGSYHGSWCWELLAPELEKLGHDVSTPDMPIGDPAMGAAGYTETVIEALDAATARGGSDRTTAVVGHSMGGLVIPLVAAARPVDRLVFLCAFLPQPGMSANQQRAAEPIDAPTQPVTAEWTDLGQGVWSVGSNTATEIFFQDASPELAAWATSRLRPQSYLVMNEVTPLVAWPHVRADYILCRDDRALNPAWARRAARERLGIDAVELDGGHSPFLTRPAELAQTIDRILRAPQ